MKINIGSTNPSKIAAVKEAIKSYSFLSSATVKEIEVFSNVSDQPIGIDEIMQGSINRAKNAFKDCDISFGIESGLIIVPSTRTNYMDITVCTIFDGKNNHSGISCAFELPKKVIDIVNNNKMNLSQAFKEANLTKSNYIGYEEGIIGVLTKGRITRTDYTIQAIQMALIQIENKELYT